MWPFSYLLRRRRDRNFYYFIDETGDLERPDSSGSQVFLMTCIVSENREALVQSISELRAELLEKKYFQRFEEFKQNGFHAAANHPDIRTQFISKIHKLPYRAYVIYLNKKDPKFSELLKEKKSAQIYNEIVGFLLWGRILKGRNDSNFFYFEQNLANPTPGEISKRKMELEAVINEILKKQIKANQLRAQNNVQFEVFVKDKSELPLAISDYIGYVVLKILEGSKDKTANARKVEPIMKQNYKLLESKIALLYDFFQERAYRPRFESLDIDSLFIK